MSNLTNTLAGMVDAGRVPHAILLHEDDGGGGVALAMEFLGHLYGGNPRVAKMIHPDIHYIFPLILSSGDSVSEQYASEWRTLVLENPSFTEGDLYTALGFEGKNTVISVKEANALLRVLSRYSLEGGYTSVLIYLPEKMNSTAANRLLKILEEPPEQTIFVMVTHAPEKLLPTIISRCQLFRVEAAAGAEDAALRYDDGGLLGALMSAVISRDLSAALEVGEQLAALPSRDSARAFCRYASGRMRRVFLYQQGLDSLAGGDEEARRWAAAAKKTFPRKAMEALDKASGLIGRNVNLKILFTDLVDRLFVNI
jgi:DNA polymerase-3 subunit delta'